MHKLSRKTISDPKVRKLKILQFGGGNFLRAFVDWMVQRMNDICDYQGGIILVKPTEGGNYDELIGQDGLYHVVTSGFVKGQVIEHIELISCIDRIIHPYEQFVDFLDTAKREELHVIVSNTTESGIVYQKENKSASPPDSFPGKLCRWLKERFDHFEGDPSCGCIILPCELIEANGDTLKNIIIRIARDWDYGDGFVKWLEEHNIFCNTLVDRIVPGKPNDEKLKQYQEELDFEDQQMVVGEPYHLFVIEGPTRIEEEFPLQKAGIQAIYTDDLSKYRLQKVRLLNGAHTSMVPIGLLTGMTSVGEFINDPVLGAFLEKTMRQEIILSIKDVDKEQLENYTNDILDRFRNPFVQHKLKSIALNSLSKFVVRVLPSIESYLELHEKLPERLVVAFAALIRFYQGEWREKELPVQDDQDLIEIIQNRWKEYLDGNSTLVQLSENLLSDKRLWGRNLNEIPKLRIHLAGALQIIERGDLEDEIRRLS